MAAGGSIFGRVSVDCHDLLGAERFPRKILRAREILISSGFIASRANARKKFLLTRQSCALRMMPYPSRAAPRQRSTAAYTVR